MGDGSGKKPAYEPKVELDEFGAKTTIATREELVWHRVPMEWRDNCSALLIPLNLCRHEHRYLPWHCEDERHTYEKCQYDDLMRRMKKAARISQKMATTAAEEAELANA